MKESLQKIAENSIGQIISDLYKYTKGKLKKEFEKISAEENLKKIYQSIDKVGKVTTIYNPDKIFYLEDIYSEDAVSIEGIKKVNNSLSFYTRHILVEGGPGQGKSFLLKYICINEIHRTETIPIFIEFRRMNFKLSFMNSILDQISNFGLKIDEEIFEYLVDNELIILIIDGFDEIPSQHRSKYADGLENLARDYSELRIIISSRPDYGLSGSIFFNKFKMNKLGVPQQSLLVQGLCKPDIANEIIHVINKNKFISEIITSPLLVTLFVITYNSTQFNPNNLTEFYHVIFTTMLYRHDRLKLTFERERRSNLTDFNLQKSFEVISFVLLRKNLSSFNKYDFLEAVNKAIQTEGLEEDIEEDIIDDITMITALIIKDGYNFYSYAHKSIQEYFASEYIKRSPNRIKMRFYTSLSKDYDSYQQWKNVLNFLEITDNYMYSKYFYLNMVKHVTGYEKDNNKLLREKILEQIPENTTFLTNENGKLKHIFWVDTFSSSAFKDYHNVIFKGVSRFLNESTDEIADYIAFCDLSKYEKYHKNSDEFIVKIHDFIDDSELLIEFLYNEIQSSEFYKNISKIETRISNYERLNNDLFKGI